MGRQHLKLWAAHGRTDLQPLARHVAKAATQFDAVNADRAVPNILIFVNHADASSFADLHETLTGTFFAQNGEQYKTLIHIAGASELGLIKTLLLQNFTFAGWHPHEIEEVLYQMRP
jgi:hypothetical protein